MESLAFQQGGEDSSQHDIVCGVQANLRDVDIWVYVWFTGVIVRFNGHAFPIGRQGSLHDVGDERILVLL